MQHAEPLATRSLGAVIEAIASDDVVPGAGSAAAVGLALAAACARKAVAISLKHRPHDPVLVPARDVLDRIGHRALHGADEDAASFREFMHDKDAAAAEGLVDTGRRLERLGVELRGLLDSLTQSIEPIVRGDISAAITLCSAFSAIQSENLAENQQAAARSKSS